jgi:prolyl oligopeptidase
MLVSALLVTALAAPALPPTPKRPVTDTYHGVAVTEDYRWLEDGDASGVTAWWKAEDAAARAHFRKAPGAAAIRARVKQLMTVAMPRYLEVVEHGGVVFALKYQPPRQQASLVVLGSVDDLSMERPLLDPNVLDPTGKTAIDFFKPSLDGKRVAVSLSKDGTEDGTVRVVEVPSGKELPDRLPRVNGGTAGGGLAWNADGTGFWYTRYPREGERPASDLAFYQQVWFHRLGEPESSDVRGLGDELEAGRIAENFLSSSPDGRFALDAVQKGDGNEWEVWLAGPTGKWSRVAGYADEVKSARLGRDGQLYLLSRKGALGGRVLRVPASDPAVDRATVVAEASDDAPILGFEVTRTRLYLLVAAGGPTRVRVLSLDGKELAPLALPPVTAIALLSSPDHFALEPFGDDGLVYRVDSYLEPQAWYHADAGGKVRRLAISSTSPVDFSGVEVVREYATSRDGTKVPLNILRRKGTPLDGKSPALLTGYGGYGVNLAPRYQPILKLWLEQGGVYAEANLRGGGEYGEGWHRAGMLTRKQNVFDDFIACADHLVKRGYTRPQRLAIRGGSNGGLLMGAVLTQRPDLAAVVVARVGIFDMLRVELDPNGAFNVTEYGTVKDPEQFRALRAYSPYHHVKDGTAYPAVLLTTGVHDPRVDPRHPRKMVARLQAATSSRKPILLRVNQSGHGLSASLDERIDEEADIEGFVFEQLGLRYRPATPAL